MPAPRVDDAVEIGIEEAAMLARNPVALEVRKVL
jgi:hypothetical protein